MDDPAAADTPASPPRSQDPTVAALLRCDHDHPPAPPRTALTALDHLDILDGLGKLEDLDRAAAVCAGQAGVFAAADMKRIDWDKAKEQIAAREPSAVVRSMAVQQLLALRLDVQQTMSKLDAAETAKAEAAYTEWFSKTFTPNKALFLLAFTAIDKAMGPGDPKGCGDALKGEVESRIKARKLRNIKDGEDLWEDPVMGVLLQAKALCDAVDQPLLGANEIFVANHGKRWLGPRRAALLALKIDANTLAPAHHGYPSSQSSAYYEIKSVTPKGDKLLVALSSDQRAQAVLSCHDNDHIDRILPDGSIRYKEDCVQTGSTQLKNDYAPLLVPKDFADLVKPGRVVLFSTEKGNNGIERDAGDAAYQQAAIEAVPVYVFPDSNASRAGRPLLFFNGVRLP
ncbi:MAG: hypothetical protein U0359_09225 [Byssovorax sp.]